MYDDGGWVSPWIFLALYSFLMNLFLHIFRSSGVGENCTWYLNTWTTQYWVSIEVLMFFIYYL
jgi:hypothetical protein